jgi:predicted metal-dependent hydrolase
MKFLIDDKEYEVVIQKKNNKNTYIRVKEDLKIYVTTSYFASKLYIYNLLEQNKEYLKKVLTKQEIKNENTSFKYLGKKYDVIICNIVNKVELDENKIYTPSEKELDKYIKKNTLELFKERLDYNYNLFLENIPYPKLKIRTMKTRWGVCNKRDNSVTLNSKLIEYNIEALDYVIIHELSHFVHFNHSKEFWMLVSKYNPNYKQIKKYLKEE